MKANEIPAGPGLRERVLVEVAELRQQYLEARQSGTRLRWLGVEYWIDHERWLVLSVGVAKYIGVLDLATVPDEKYELIELRGCRKTTATVSEVIRLLAAFVLGPDVQPTGAGANFINFVVVQPLLNPAFEALFWFALARQLEPNRTEPTLGDALGDLAIDLSRYPASRSEAPGIRKAQVQWVKRELEPDLDVIVWTQATDQAWAAHCNELMHAHRSKVDTVFFEASHVAGRIVAGAYAD
jgi:hypothetical protein